jgi:hypothetical protein
MPETTSSGKSLFFLVIWNRWGRHFLVVIELVYGTVEVPNSNSISCSLLGCSPVTQATRFRFPAETCALVEDGDDLGQVFSWYRYLPYLLTGLRKWKDNGWCIFFLPVWSRRQLRVRTLVTTFYTLMTPDGAQGVFWFHRQYLPFVRLIPYLFMAGPGPTGSLLVPSC